jgi:hypothetical protein
MPDEPKIKIMVASTVYHFEDQLAQICAVLSGFGYEVWNSSKAPFPVYPGTVAVESCLAAVRQCDGFLGIVRPFYGTGRVGDRSITHEECRAAIALNKPRWFLVHHDVVFARQLLRPLMFRKNGTRTQFTIKKTSVMDDIKVIDLYNDAMRSDLPLADRTGNWVQEFFTIMEALNYIESQFKDVERIRRICEEMHQP